MVNPCIRKVLIFFKDFVDNFIVSTESRKVVLVGLLKIEPNHLVPLQSSKIIKDVVVVLFGQSFIAEDDDSHTKGAMILLYEGELLVNYPHHLGIVIKMQHLSALGVFYKTNWFKPKLHPVIV